MVLRNADIERGLEVPNTWKGENLRSVEGVLHWKWRIAAYTPDGDRDTITDGDRSTITDDGCSLLNVGSRQD